MAAPSPDRTSVVFRKPVRRFPLLSVEVEKSLRGEGRDEEDQYEFQRIRVVGVDK